MDTDEKDNPLALQILLALGSDPNAQNNKGQTPLHLAVFHDNINIAKCLLNHGVDVDIVDNSGNTALHLVAFHEDKEHVFDCSDSLYEKRLLMAKALIENKLGVNARNWGGQTPLMKAVRGCHLGIVRYLLECGADVSAQDDVGDTALHLAAFDEDDDIPSSYFYSMRLEIVKWLLDYGSDVDAYNERLETPLMRAVRGQHLGVVQELLKFCPDLDAKNECGQTCLHILCEENPGKTDMIVELVKAGAPIQTVDNQDRTPVQCILQRRAPKWVNIKEAKEFIKIATFVNYAEKINFPVHEQLEMYARECYAEVVRMRSISCGTISNLLYFALNGRELANGDSNEEKLVIESVFQTMMRETFPIYDGYLQSHFQRSYLCRKLTEKIIYAHNDPANTVFPDHLIPKFCKYLHRDDLFNLLRTTNLTS